MSVFRRLTNVVRGQIKVWQRARDEPPIEAEVEIEPPRVVRESESVPEGDAEPGVRDPVPSTPRKRRL